MFSPGIGEREQVEIKENGGGVNSSTVDIL
jgi:hypothetical protein